ncbi:ABC transporter permease [Fimbriimonas ginsengisoli]|uniref:Oligopeptide ABC transporter permease protein n=1 Tax=Fimbriimonas ginsengisoli Gsoil 348 TaxID=661478 RepID=A0A068NIS2_FIMGI|nr:ABC transporter permease [Fimbriimonas ginsengisoli]AIE83493.1 oligopeptide ABC transporter permease protein [Fimbriimonas ginsengisoli Gsoil 348]
MRVAKPILLRLLFGLLSLIFVSFVTFVADEIAPGDAATMAAGDKATPETVERLRHQFGLDRPWPIRYVEFLGKASHGDFGESYFGTREKVSDIVKRTLPMTAKLACLAILLASGVGILLGTLAAVYKNRFADRGVLTISTLGVTVPNFVLAPLLVFIFVIKLDVLPLTWVTELKAPEIYYLILPVCILAARPMALITRLTRATMIDTMQQEFIRTAVAKGVPRRRLIFRHALRNAILPVITAIGTSFGFLLTGSFVIERYFVMPGLGSATIEAIQQGNMPVVQAGIMITGSMFILLNLFVDILLPILDPRIRESQI